MPVGNEWLWGELKDLGSSARLRSQNSQKTFWALVSVSVKWVNRRISLLYLSSRKHCSSEIKMRKDRHIQIRTGRAPEGRWKDHITWHRTVCALSHDRGWDATLSLCPPYRSSPLWLENDECGRVQALLDASRIHSPATGHPARSHAGTAVFVLCGNPRSRAVVATEMQCQSQWPRLRFRHRVFLRVLVCVMTFLLYLPLSRTRGSFVSSPHPCSVPWGCGDLFGPDPGAPTIRVPCNTLLLFADASPTGKAPGPRAVSRTPHVACTVYLSDYAGPGISIVIGQLIGVFRSLVWATRKSRSPDQLT